MMTAIRGYAYEENNIVEFPGTQKRKPGGGKPCEVFAVRREEDIRKIQRYFIQHEQYRNYLYVVMGVNLGLRGSDMVKLAWSDVMHRDGTFKTMQECFVKEKKTGKTRYLVLRDDVKQTIRMYLAFTDIKPNFDDPKDPDYYIFKKLKQNPHYDGLPYISRASIGDCFKSAARAVGIPYRVNTHSLRKTFGYRFFKQTKDIVALQKIFNHSSPAITLRYIGILDEDIASDINSMSSVVEFLSDGSDD